MSQTTYGNSLISNEMVKMFCLLLFVWGFSSHSGFFHSHGEANISGVGLQILAYARNLWPLSSTGEGCLLCHTYRDTAHVVIMVISDDPWHSIYCRAFGNRAVTTCFNDIGLSQLRFEQPTLRLQGERSYQLCHRRGLFLCPPWKRGHIVLQLSVGRYVGL